MSDPSTLETLATVIRFGVVGVGLWVLSRLWDIGSALTHRAKDREAFLRALYAEIDFNSADMQRFIDTAPRQNLLLERFADPDFVPHITDARHTEIYRSRIEMLHFLKNGLIGDVVRFYGDLEKIRTQIEGFSAKSFEVISPQGKLGTVNNLIETCSNCRDLGDEILLKMEREYSSLKLQRRLHLYKSVHINRQ